MDFWLQKAKSNLEDSSVWDALMMREIGCCGAYCRTCLEWQREKYPNEKTCRGCKLGYESSERDLGKAKCKIKVCCFGKKQLETCADCSDYPCQIITDFWNKKGWKYQQYKKQLEFIRQNGYDEFLKRANIWKGPRGKLEWQISVFRDSVNA